MKICIYGSSSDRIDEKYKKVTFDLGAALASKGHSLIYGGGAHGVMGALARGFKSKGGHVTGVIPEFFKTTHAESLYYDCDEIVWCDTMHERKQIMEGLAEAFVIAPGGVGTYDEFFAALTNKQLARHFAPIAVFSPFGFFDSLNALLEDGYKEKFINEPCRMLYRFFDDIGALIDYLENEKPFDHAAVANALKDG
ncbi:MAG: TIGR00730 family Rossman fold protein [Clostridia bacterium]|nr:TIGR00730 family Rossman fold protein [Clostridia bacterium]